MTDLGNNLGYDFKLLESIEDCVAVGNSLPERIPLFAFDTETNTKIDMSNNDGSSIDIMHDKPFLIQFGYGNTVYLADLRDISADAVLTLFDKFVTRSTLAIGQNIKFDINMLQNIGYAWHTSNCCDLMSIARLSLESKSEREGGCPLSLKPLASRLLGPQYAMAGREVANALRDIWAKQLNILWSKLKPYKINRRIISETLKDASGTLDMFPKEVQRIWIDWKEDSLVSYADIDKNLMHRYGGTDVVLTLELAKKLLPIVKEKRQMPILKKEMALIMPLVRMERTGYTVDKNYLIKCKQAVIFEINSIKDANERLAGCAISPNQHQELKKLALDKFGYVLESTDKNQMHILIDTDKSMPDDLKTYLSNVIYLRTLEKWLTTYINPMINRLNVTGDTKVYTQYNPNGAVSGRFTSNFQQFPKNPIVSRLGNFELFHPRKMFVVDKAYPEMAYIDYSQVELRLQAEYTYYVTGGTGDINMLRAYMPFKCHQDSEGKWRHNEDNAIWEGVDLHTQSTHNAFPEVPLGTPEFKKLRSQGKRVNFAMIYGASLKKVQQTLADVPPENVTRLYNGFNSAFKDVKTYGRYVARKWNENGGYVTNLLGRRYYIDDPKNVYKLNNYLIQGSAADIIKAVIIKVDEYLRKNKLKTRLQGCIHDELCICVAEGEHEVLKEIKRIMETTIKTYVPLVAEISVTATNWAEKKELK
jgi:DNA polymerase I